MNPDFWGGRRVFVTGASGLLGSALTETLLENGAEVVVLVRDWAQGSRLLSTAMAARVNMVRGDLNDLQVLVRALNEYEVDSVFHLGAQTIVGASSRSPLSTFESNIRGTWNLLEAVRTCGFPVERVVVASSDKAYGAHEQLPYDETFPLRGQFPYDVSKSCSDLITLSYHHTYRLPVTITRCGNLFGPGDLNFNRLIPGTIRSLLQGSAPVIRSDGKFERDYVYVRDAVAAYMALAERTHEEEIRGQAFNFGSGIPMNVIEVVDRIRRAMGRADLQPMILNEASREIPRQFLDSGKANRVLRWFPAYEFDQALEETIGWYRQVLPEVSGVSRDSK